MRYFDWKWFAESLSYPIFNLFFLASTLSRNFCFVVCLSSFVGLDKRLARLLTLCIDIFGNFFKFFNILNSPSVSCFWYGCCCLSQFDEWPTRMQQSHHITSPGSLFGLTSALVILYYIMKIAAFIREKTKHKLTPNWNLLIDSVVKKIMKTSWTITNRYIIIFLIIALFFLFSCSFAKLFASDPEPFMLLLCKKVFVLKLLLDILGWLWPRKLEDMVVSLDSSLLYFDESLLPIITDLFDTF